MVYFKILLATICLAVIAQPSFALTCGKAELEWTGFKTPKKIGVSGKFTKIVVKGKPGETVAKTLPGMTFDIDTQALDSGDESRDMKIAKIFFGSMKNSNRITGSLVKLDAGYMIANVRMNGVEKQVPLKYSVSGNTVTANGYLDILDFAGAASLSAINKACFTQHEGKTWSEVGVRLQLQCR